MEAVGTHKAEAHDQPTEEQLREERTLIHAGAHTLASGMGLASVIGAIAGPEGAVVGAIGGGIIAVILSAMRRYRDE